MTSGDHLERLRGLFFGPFGLTKQIGLVEYSRERRFLAKLDQWLDIIRVMWPACPARITGRSLILDRALGSSSNVIRPVQTQLRTETVETPAHPEFMGA